MMRSVYTVGQVNAYIKNMFTQDFLLKRIYVKGEVSNCKYHPSGHVYFSLKDESGTIPCVMFAGARKGLAFRMENGQAVIVLGTVSVYERDGRYQLYANEIIREGAGLLYERFEKLKRELMDMGMFDAAYKKKIPKYVKTLGIVTASTGAAVRDIINISKRRNPFIQLVLYPATVQGEEAAESIVRGIRLLDDYGVDVMIVGRGGGSMEDLWAFNEETVARAIFACGTPIISAVGHETDTTIADYVADLRAPTPSAGAELAVADIHDLLEQRESFYMTLNRLMDMKLREARMRAEQYALRVRQGSPVNQIREKQQRLVDSEDALHRLMEERIKEKRQSLALYAERMEGVSPLRKLKQGYAYVSKEDGSRITRAEDGKKGDLIRIYFSDGFFRACVEEEVREEESFAIQYKEEKAKEV